jgi:hypothetical protein
MRLRTMVIFGAGYAWGAWTGRARFVEFADRARSLLDSDLVRDYLERVQVETGNVGQRVGVREEDDAEEPEDVGEFDEAEDEDVEDEDVDDGYVEDEDEDDVEAEAAEPAAADREPEPARSGRAVRRRAPGRARR